MVSIDAAVHRPEGGTLDPDPADRRIGKQRSSLVDMRRLAVPSCARLLLPALVLGLLAATPVPASGFGMTHITAIAWEPEGQIGKVIIQLDGPVTYRTVASPTSIVVDMWAARHAEWRAQSVVHPYVQGVRINQITEDLARVRIDLWRPARYKTFVNDRSRTLAIVVIPPWMATSPLPDSVVYEQQRVRTGAGTTAVHVLRINPHDPNLEIRPTLAADMVSGTETTSIIATRHDAIAGINGGYFGGPGMPLGMVMIDGQLLSAPLPRRSVFALSRLGVPMILDFQFSGRMRTEQGLTLPVNAVNAPPQPGGIAIYTPDYGPLTPPSPAAIRVRRGLAEVQTSGKILIPSDGYVLTAASADAGLLSHVQPGTRVAVTLSISPDLEIVNALGGGPRLVKDGLAFVPFAWEWFSPRHTTRRYARTAVGITSAGKLLLVTVDGGNRRNTGMTLNELAEAMVQLGARDGMNLDGGGSATMVVGGRLANDPADGIERPIASALLILSKTAIHSPEDNAPEPRSGP